MELRVAKRIFNIDNPQDLGEINTTFKKLVKKYHPDKLIDYSTWANERMSEVNEAYEVLLDWFKNKPARTKEQYQETWTKDYYSPPHSKTEHTDNLTPEENRYICTCFSIFLEGLTTYYQYGLQKTVYRSEGIRRFRFRESTRIITRACEDIDKLFRESEKKENTVFTAVSNFMRYTLADISIGKPVFPEQAKYRAQDTLFNSARELFDDAVREIFFPEIVKPHLLGKASTRLYSSYPVFVYFCMTFIHSERGEIGKIMLERHHALTDLLELDKKGIFSLQV